MEAISATPTPLKDLFRKNYIIPDFQRPYSWDTDNASQLWSDIEAFCSREDLGKDEQYFLGSLVTYSDEEDRESLVVVDGQQRLTTLSLLLKVLFERDIAWKNLERYLRKEDYKDSATLLDDLRIQYQAHDETGEIMSHIILLGEKAFNDWVDQQGEKIRESALIVNYRFFQKEVTDWVNDKNRGGSEHLGNLIKHLQERVVVLPILCGDQDNALDLFQVINDRGKPLSESDIFKAKLMKSLDKTDFESFTEAWDALEGHDTLFRILMHAYRAEQGIVKREIALGAFFMNQKEKKEGAPQDWHKTPTEILHRLTHFSLIQEGSWMDEMPEVGALYMILRLAANDLWKYPFILYVEKHSTVGEEGQGQLEISKSDNESELVKFLQAFVRFYAVMGPASSLDYMKSPIYRASRDVIEGKNLELVYSSSQKEAALDNIKTNCKQSYKRFIYALYSYLYPRQDIDAFYKLLKSFDKESKNLQIEHILPKSWRKEYQGYWTEKESEQYRDSLGNLSLLERRVNGGASNKYFDHKKEYYRASKFASVRALCGYPVWDKEACEARKTEIVKTIKKFI